MALRFIFGGAGSGKTTYCIEDIINAANAGSSPLFYIVPEQYTLEAEKSLVARFAGKSVIKAQVLSFERLSYHVLSETGAKAGRVLDSVGKSMVIRKVLHDTLPKLKYYQKMPVSAGFVKNISGTIKELYQSETSGECLTISDYPGTHQAHKFEDIRLIFDEYKAFVENNYISSDAALDILNDNIDQSRLVRGATIWIDNFSGFTAQEYSVIGNLLKLASQVNVCVNLNDSAICYDSPALDDLYYESKHLVNKLADIARGSNVTISTPVYLAGSHRFKNSPELKWLMENYEKPGMQPFCGNNEKVVLSSLPNKYIEVQTVADNIIRLVRDEGLKFCEIAVLPGDLDGYVPILQNTFARYNIPCFTDLRIGVLFHPLSEFVRALFEVIMKNWSHESVFRLLKTGLIDISEDEIDALENYVIEYGIRGNKWAYEEWKHGFSEHSPYDKQAIHDTKEAVYSSLSGFSAKYSAKGKVKPADVCRDIYGFLMQLNVPDKLAELAMSAASEQDMYLYRIHSGIWNVHMSVLEKVALIFDDMEMTTTQFAEILFMGLASCDMGIIPPSKDQVVVGDIYRSRLSDIKAVFILGMTSDNIPKKVDSDGLLDDNDKAFLEKSGIELGANSDKQTYINSHMVFRTLTKASDYLFLYYPERDLGGKANTPSPLLWRIRKLFDFDRRGQEQGSSYITLPKPMLETFGEVLKGDSATAHSKELRKALISWYAENETYASLLQKTDDARAHSHLGDEALQALYRSDIVTGISRLERYAECPFSYFIRYNLKARERADYRVRDVDLGNIFHDALELFTGHLQDNNLDWGTLDYDYIDAAVEGLFANFEDNNKSDVFSYDAKSGYILEQVKRISKRSIWALGAHIKAGDFKPLAAEISFDKDAGIRVSIDETRKFILTGRIDRVDMMEKDGETYVKIIDYKSGSKALDITDIYHGRQLQLLTYMGALAERGDKILGLPKKPKPGGLFYFRFDDPMTAYKEGATELEAYDAILGQFKMSGIVLGEDALIEGMDRNITKSSQIIPVNMSKTGEYTSRTGKLVSAGDFERVMNFANKKIGEIGKQIVSGNIEAKPYRRGEKTGCDYCPYMAVCGFGEDGKGQYRNFYKVKGLEELR